MSIGFCEHKKYGMELPRPADRGHARGALRAGGGGLAFADTPVDLERRFRTTRTGRFVRAPSRLRRASLIVHIRRLADTERRSRASTSPVAVFTLVSREASEEATTPRRSSATTLDSSAGGPNRRSSNGLVSRTYSLKPWALRPDD